MGKIKAFIYGRFDSGKILHIASNERSQEKSIIEQSEYVIKKLKEIRLVANERQKITLENTGGQYQWFCMCDSQDIIYLTICTLDYPERYAYEMIQELKKHFLKISDNYGEEVDTVLKMHGKNTAENLLIHYNSDGVDKLKQIQGKIDATQSAMKENINIAINNMDHADTALQKSEKMQLQSKQLQSQAKDLESIMKWRNYKLNIIFFLIVVGIALYIIIAIVK
ncbi:synaptobrevin (macronuclear) [Tetrahymena thermophila SB210]|uniref:Synaptobrevin n=1 Tax=Tetrahymena thermophila (strain SB210) TaxID=312017 RepID=Q245X9_TETTS|nr:synaptobrevin [Tetrahymena thermophila SB210]EAS03504.1 synaptobrevin [Tetrahymena thermophila SB210]|eukprot:XP_001023749.1 synaptobrevin [Tetrahymena thermophila SB210]